MKPKLSVLMPTFNRVHWLREAIGSVLVSSLDLELVVLDNGSSDGTWALLRELADQDPRIRPVRWDVNDALQAYPSLLEMAMGEYVNFFADDDRMLPGGLERKVALLDRDPEVGMVFSAVRCMDGAGKDLGEGEWTVIAQEDFPGRADLFDSLIVSNCVPMPSAMFRRALSPTGVILRDPAFKPSHDWQFWLDLALRTRIAYLRQPTICLRLHEGQGTVTHGVRLGWFIEVDLRIWRHWMIEAESPYLPSAATWGAMMRTLAGALQATHGTRSEKVQEGLRRFLALRIDQDARLARDREDQEAPYPEAFLLEASVTPDAWRNLLLAYGRAFGAEDPVVLALLLDPSRKGTLGAEAAREVVEDVTRNAGGGPMPRVAVLEPDQVLGALRGYPHLQMVSLGPDSCAGLEGVKGGRLAGALRLRAGEVLA